MTLSDLEAGLKEVYEDVYHIGAPEGKTKCIIWAETGKNGFEGDDEAIEWPVVTIEVDTQDDDNTFFEAVINKLKSMDLVYVVNSYGFDDQYQLRNMILTVEVI